MTATMDDGVAGRTVSNDGEAMARAFQALHFASAHPVLD
jgi:hypothetical protein